MTVASAALDKKMVEEDINLWLITMQRSNKTKTLHPDYYVHISKFYKDMWDKNYYSISKDPYYRKLKPSIQNELCDNLFEVVYKDFADFFEDLEDGFKRELVKKMQYQHFELFPLYQEKFKKDRHSVSPIQDRCILPKYSVPHAVFFILKGEVYGSNATGRYCYFKFKEKMQFGETHVIDDLPLEYTIFYSETTAVSALVVPLDDFKEV